MSESSESERTVRFVGVDTTEDTGDPVLRAQINATGSYMFVILNREDSTIHVWKVESQQEGDMKLMLDTTVRKLGWQDVVFLSPLDDLKAVHQTKLKDRLDGFETYIETIRKPDGTTEEQKRYRGTWELR